MGVVCGSIDTYTSEALGKQEGLSWNPCSWDLAFQESSSGTSYVNFGFLDDPCFVVV